MTFQAVIKALINQNYVMSEVQHVNSLPLKHLHIIIIISKEDTNEGYILILDEVFYIFICINSSFIISTLINILNNEYNVHVIVV